LLSTIAVVIAYVFMTLYRPDLKEITPHAMIGNFYLPWDNVLSVGITAIVLLGITKNFWASLMAGIFATLIWEFPIQHINRHIMAGGNPIKYMNYLVAMYMGWMIRWVFSAMIVLMFVCYYVKLSCVNEPMLNKILKFSAIIYIITLILFFLLPDIVSPAWTQYLRGQLPRGVNWGGRPFGILVRTSGYITWSLLAIKIFSGGEQE